MPWVAAKKFCFSICNILFYNFWLRWLVTYNGWAVYFFINNYTYDLKQLWNNTIFLFLGFYTVLMTVALQWRLTLERLIHPLHFFFSFSRLLWLFRVFCVFIKLLKYFILVLWRMSLVMWKGSRWTCRLLGQWTLFDHIPSSNQRALYVFPSVFVISDFSPQHHSFQG